MKVTLDLTKLLEEGKITREEHDRLAQLGAAGTGSLAFNILLGFGVIAVSAGAVALVPDAITGIVLGAIVLGAGLALYATRRQQWEVLAHICVLVGALGLAGRNRRRDRGLGVGLPGDHDRLRRGWHRGAERAADYPRRARLLLDPSARAPATSTPPTFSASRSRR